MDFNASLPSLAPLANSRSSNDYESQLKEFFLALWDTLLAERSADIGVLGNPHLGSFDLVQREMNSDGLVLLRSDGSEALTRYLYKAWRSNSRAGRGLHFLRTYLQAQFPNGFGLDVLWFSLGDNYPASSAKNEYWRPMWDDQDLFFDSGVYFDTPVSWRTSGDLSDRDGYWQSSRVNVSIDYRQIDASELETLKDILRTIVPAKVVPILRLWQRSEARMFADASATYTEVEAPDSNLSMNGAAVVFDDAEVSYV